MPRMLYDHNGNAVPTESENILMQVLNETEQSMAEASYVRPYDYHWQPKGEADWRTLTEQGHQALRKSAVRAVHTSLLMRGYLRNMRNFVIGVGPTLTPMFDDDHIDRQAAAWWSQFKKLNNWHAYEKEMPYNTWRDGETFTRFFVHNGSPRPIEWPARTQQLLASKGMQSYFTRPRMPAGMVSIRLVDPDNIHDPTGAIEEGILVDPEDEQTVLGYCLSKGTDLVSIIPAGEMMHVKIGSDSDQKRGRSILEGLLAMDSKYQNWLDNRITLSKVRNAIALIKRIENATSEQVQAFKNRAETTRNNTDAYGENRSKGLKPGTVFTATPNVKYDMLSPNVQAADAQHDGREIKLNMAAGASMPEYLFTADASNGNFASTMVAEGPGMREMEAQRDSFAPHYKHIWVEVVKSGARHGHIDIDPDRVSEDTVDLAWQPLVTRDELKHAQAQKIRKDAGVLSAETWQIDAGLNPETERQNMEQERQELAGQGIPPDLLAQVVAMVDDEE